MPMTADAGRESRLVAGRYALTEVLGRGGMGIVWLADDKVLERQVALKEITFPIDLTAEERAVLSSGRCARPGPPPASTIRA